MLRRLMRIITVLTGLLLVLSAHSGFVNPQVFWPPAFLALGFTMLLIVHILLLLFWLFKWNPYCIFSVACLLFTYPTTGRYFQLSLFNDYPQGTEESALRVMSYNVRVFDLYNWTGNGNSKARIMKLIHEVSPDIACFQEFFHSDKPGYFATRDTLSEVLNNANAHLHYTTVLRNEDNWGIATYTKFPIIYKGVVELPQAWNNTIIYTDIVAKNDTLRVYNIHLASVGLQAADYKLLEDIKDNGDKKEFERTVGVVSRLKKAFVKRSEQVRILKKHISESPYPVIVCGDLNDTPASYAYKQLRKGLRDGFVEKGTGPGITYPGVFPGYRIDYILTDKNLHPVKSWTIRENLSDHYPVVLDLFVR